MVMNLMNNFRNTNEQDLVANLVEEAIEQRGLYVHYIVRNTLNMDYILGESSMSEFTEFYLIPMYLESMEHFGGSGDVKDMFGNNYVDEAIYQVGVKRFKIELEKGNLGRPREGDLIYNPMSDSLWEITKVKNDQKYYQVGKNNSYRLVCKLFSFSHEKIETDTEGDFNTLGSTKEFNVAGISQRILGLPEGDTTDQTEIFKDNAAQVAPSFDPNNPFKF